VFRPARWFPLAGLLLAASVLLAAPSLEPPAPGEKKEPPAGPAKPPPTLRELSLPSGAVVVVCEKVAQALDLVPEGILLDPRQYQEFLRLREQVHKLEARARALNISPPSECRLTGDIVGEQAVLQARFAFATSREGEVVALGCGGAIPTDVSLTTTAPRAAGEEPQSIQTTPRLHEGSAGWLVQVGAPGDHQLTLDLVYPLNQGPAEAPDRRSLLLSLPGAPITSLRLTLPKGAREVHLGKAPLAETVLTQKGNTLAGPLRRTDKLELTWEVADDSGNLGRTAEGVVVVRLTGSAVVSEVALTLRARHATASWDLLLPARADVRASPDDAKRVRAIRKVKGKGPVPAGMEAWEVTLQAKESTPLTVQVRVPRPRPKPGVAIPIGPFEVVGAVRQTGEILVVNRTPHLYLEFRPRRDPWAWGPGGGGRSGGLTQLAVSDRHRRLAAGALTPGAPPVPEGSPAAKGESPEVEVAAAFGYAWLAGAPRAGASDPAGAWLEIEGEPFRGRLQTHTSHELTLVKVGGEENGGAAESGEGGSGHAGPIGPGPNPAQRSVWRVVTTLQVTAPAGPSTDVIEVALPPGYVPDQRSAVSSPPDRFRDSSVDAETGVLQLRLRPARGGSAAKDFSITWSGQLTVAADSGAEGARPPKTPGGRRWVLPLPLPRGTIDQGGVVTVQVRPEQELMVLPGANSTLELARRPPGPEALGPMNRQRWQAEPGASPDRIVVAWRRYLPEVNADSTIDVDLSPRRARVRHRLQFRFDQPAPEKVLLRIPQGLLGRLRIEGGELLPGPETNEAAPGEGKTRTEKAPAPGKAPGIGPPVMRAVRLQARAGNEHVLTLDYGFPITSGLFAVPLVSPAEVTRGEQKVRVWVESSLSPDVTAVPSPDQPWVTRNVEAVAGRDRLPVLVLWSGRVDAGLRLHREEGPGGAEDGSWVVWPTRALMQVDLRPDGAQDWRARFVLARLAADLDVVLPAPPEGIELKVFLDGKGVPAVAAPGSSDRRGYRVRLRFDPDLVREGSILELTYRLLPGHVSAQAFTDVLRPPRLMGQPREEALPVCWDVRLPSGRVVVSPEPGRSIPITWGWRGWLWAPQLGPGVTEDLRGWLGAPRWDRTALASSATGAGQERGPPSLVCWSHGGEPLSLVHTTERAWLLLCSLGLLLVGLGLGILAQPSFRKGHRWPNASGRMGPPPAGAGAFLTSAGFWVALLLLALLAAAVGVLRPGVLGQVLYGCQPGVIVLLGVGIVQWLVIRRRRRRLLFLPSFRREPRRSTFPGEPLPDSTGSWPRSPSHQGNGSQANGSGPRGRKPEPAALPAPAPEERSGPGSSQEAPPPPEPSPGLPEEPS
jgi:hypothetical protein